MDDQRPFGHVWPENAASLTIRNAYGVDQSSVVVNDTFDSSVLRSFSQRRFCPGNECSAIDMPNIEF